MPAPLDTVNVNPPNMPTLTINAGAAMTVKDLRVFAEQADPSAVSTTYTIDSDPAGITVQDEYASPWSLDSGNWSTVTALNLDTTSADSDVNVCPTSEVLASIPPLTVNGSAKNPITVDALFNESSESSPMGPVTIDGHGGKLAIHNDNTAIPGSVVGAGPNGGTTRIVDNASNTTVTNGKADSTVDWPLIDHGAVARGSGADSCPAGLPRIPIGVDRN